VAINFSDPSLTRIFDRNNDGNVTRKELKQVLAADGNKKDLSVKDLEAVGITDTQTQTSIINSYKEHKSETNFFSFPLFNNKENTNKTTSQPVKDDGNDYWANDLYDKHKNDKNEPIIDRKVEIDKGVNKFNKNDLLKQTKNDENVKELLSLVGNDKKAGHYISKLFENNPEKASEICKSLSTYLKTDPPSGALISKDLKKQYVTDLLHDISYPTDINQQQEGTCTATSVQVKLAKEDPKKYIELATTLADGKNWNKIPPNRNLDLKNSGMNINDPKGKGIDIRTLSEKVVQNSFMDYGNGGQNGDWGSRAIAEKSNETRNDKIEFKGMEPKELRNLQEAVFGNAIILSGDTDKIFKQIDKNLDEGNSIPFTANGIDPEDGEEKAHEMLVLSNNKDGTYNIFTWGQEITVSAEDLRKHLLYAEVSDANA